MLRPLLLAVMCSIGFKDCKDPRDTVVQTLNVQNITENLLQNPDGKQQMETLGTQLWYTFGARDDGDALVAVGLGGQTWPTARDVKLIVAYPKEGTGATITYVQILVEQSSNLGKAHITKGGIGQNNIVIEIDAVNITYYKAYVQIYGYSNAIQAFAIKFNNTI